MSLGFRAVSTLKDVSCGVGEALTNPPFVLACGEAFPSMTTPSITYRGSDPVKEVMPRMRTETAAPGCPEFWVTVTPDTRPWSIWSMLGWGTSAMSFDDNEEMAPLTSSFFWVPYPMTTTSPKVAVEVIIETLKEVLVPMDNSRSCIPTKETTSDFPV